GLLRVVRRESGIRIYGAHEHASVARDAATRREHLDGLVDVVVAKYAPLPAASLSYVVRRLRYAAPQWTRQLGAALERAKRRLAHARIDGVDWYWPASAVVSETSDIVRLLAPFDPVVWDRRRFEILWGWAYRFEAYTPVPKRKLGYYALPLLWRDRVIGWANVSATSGRLDAKFGYVASRPHGPVFRNALEEELHRLGAFLGLPSQLT
ncbi:MAG TPA: crosslink repair DNA glycosylase YcaQ family protein, partial [Vicinamibacterales bacterium]|nr:crosslink repair DNA glycosylase YcaQ family protein [Vicinamibacterales bacterium]